MRYKFPIFTQSIKEGIYTNYEELKNNSPSNLEDFDFIKNPTKTKGREETEEVQITFKTSKGRLRPIFAASKDGEVYIAHQDKFFPLHIEEYELFFVGEAPGGSLNYVATDTVFKGIPMTVMKPVSKKDKSKPQKIKFYLHRVSGYVFKLDYLTDKK